MLLSFRSGQHVGEASADTDTDVFGDAAGHGRAVADRGRAARRVALTHRRTEPGRDAADRGRRRETSTDVRGGPAGERTRRRRTRRVHPRRGLDLTEVE